jgi:cytosine/uracil/thiamine/allantoin permease
VIIGGILGTITALLFPTLLNYEHFLLFIGAMFCPLFGVVLTDYFLVNKGVLEAEELYRKEGKYWFWRGMNPVAILSWAIGFAVYLGFSPLLLEKVLGIKTAFPWALGSSLPSMLLAGLIYWFFPFKAHRR